MKMPMFNANIFYDGIEYQPVTDASLVPGGKHRFDTAVVSAIRVNDTPDDMGVVDLYILKYVVIDEEDFENGTEWYDNVDWTDPDGVDKTNYGWLLKEQRMV